MIGMQSDFCFAPQYYYWFVTKKNFAYFFSYQLVAIFYWKVSESFILGREMNFISKKWKGKLFYFLFASIVLLFIQSYHIRPLMNSNNCKFDVFVLNSSPFVVVAVFFVRIILLLMSFLYSSARWAADIRYAWQRNNNNSRTISWGSGVLSQLPSEWWKSTSESIMVAIRCRNTWYESSINCNWRSYKQYTDASRAQGLLCNETNM